MTTSIFGLLSFIEIAELRPPKPAPMISTLIGHTNRRKRNSLRPYIVCFKEKENYINQINRPFSILSSFTNNSRVV